MRDLVQRRLSNQDGTNSKVCACAEESGYENITSSSFFRRKKDFTGGKNRGEGQKNGRRGGRSG